MIRPIRRIVTHNDPEGLSYALLDGPAGNVMPQGMTEIWMTGLSLPGNASTQDLGPDIHTLEPPKNGTVFRFFQVSQESSMPKGTPEEVAKGWSNFFASIGASHVQPDTRRHPGMHKTKTTDYIILLSGSITLVLDKEEITLRPLDAVIQRGTNHAWVNRGSEPALLMGVLVDAS
jgi:Cupin domain